MKKFSVAAAQSPVEFQVGTDTFYALAPDSVPANILIRYTELIEDNKLFEAHKTFFNRVLVGESADQFIHRMDSTDNPINLAVMIQVAEWLIEMYAAFDVKKS